MRGRLHRNTKETKPEMTPLIDVTFLLLIFFIVTLKFRTLEGRFDASLPKNRGVGTQQTDPIEKVDIVVRLLVPGDRHHPSFPEPDSGRVLRYMVGTRSFTNLGALTDHLRQFDRVETPISIDPRNRTLNGDVVPVLDALYGLRFEQISFVAMQSG